MTEFPMIIPPPDAKLPFSSWHICSHAFSSVNNSLTIKCPLNVIYNSHICQKLEGTEQQVWIPHDHNISCISEILHIWQEFSSFFKQLHLPTAKSLIRKMCSKRYWQQSCHSTIPFVNRILIDTISTVLDRG